MFVIDATGSMGWAIDGVKSNIASFAEELESRGMDVRFALIEFRDVTIGEVTKVHRWDSYEWTESAAKLEEALSTVIADGGGDYPETPTEAIMQLFDTSIFRTVSAYSGPFRVGASKFVFLMTDASAKEGTSGGGVPTIEAVAGRLRTSQIHTIVVCPEDCEEQYRPLYQSYSGGTFLNIYGDYYESMLEVAELVYEVSGLTVEAFERGRATDDDKDLNPESYNTIRYIRDGKYITSTGEPITEYNIANLGYEYSKVGYTADGNTRLIIRVQNDKPGTVTLAVPEGYGTLQTIDGVTLGTSGTKTAEHIGNMYQASFVLLAPESYPYKDKLIGDNFPKEDFSVVVRFEESTAIVYKNLNLSINATPVVMIHGLATSYNNTFHPAWPFGIYHVLNSKGITIRGYDYGGTEGPTYHIINKYSGDVCLNTSGMFRNIAGTMREMVKQGIACTRVDLVCHSMGGLMARTFMEYDDCRSERSYNQSMIRRVVTVATPHEGSPWPTYLLGGWESLPYVMGHSYDELDEAHADAWSWLEQHRTILNGIMSSTIWRSTYPEEALKDLSLGSTLVNELHSKSSPRPIAVIYGTISNDLSEIFDRINSVVDAVDTEAKIGSVIKDLAVGNIVGALITALPRDTGDAVPFIDKLKAALEIIFNENDHDFAVGEDSARSIFSTLKYEGAKYNHMLICQQNDVGNFVFDLLKAGDDNFNKPSPSVSTASTSRLTSSTPARNHSASYSAATTSIDNYFVNALTLTAETSAGVFTAPNTITTTYPATVSFTVSSEEDITHNVYMSVRTDSGSGFIKLASTDEGTFTLTVGIESSDTGTYTFYSSTQGSSDNVYISDKITLVVQPNLAFDGDYVTGLSFLNGETITFSSADSEVGVSLFAQTYEGKMFDVASPLMGTIWTASDPEIAEVTESGRVKALKAGSTTLTASYESFTASISVDVAVQGDVSVRAALTSQDLYILNTSLPDGKAGEFYYCLLDTTVSLTNNVVWTVKGLPAGISCDASGILTGKPVTYGTYSVNVTASDDAETASKSFTLSIAAPDNALAPIISTLSVPAGTLSEDYEAVIAAVTSGDTSAMVWEIYSGSLPEGLSFASLTGESVTLSGVPTESGSFTFMMRVSLNGYSDMQTFSLVITAPTAPAITTSSLPAGTVGTAYTAHLEATGTAPINWSVSAGNLPGGLTLSADTGTIAGTPRTAGTFLFTASAANTAGIVSRDFSITVRAASSPSIGQDTEDTESDSTVSDDVTPAVSDDVTPVKSDDITPPEPAKSDDITPHAPAKSDDVTPPEPAKSDDITPPEPAKSDDVTPPEPAKSDDIAPPEPEDIETGPARDVSSLSASELAQVSNDRSIIAAILPEITVNVSGVYDFNDIELAENVTTGALLVWNPFARDSQVEVSAADVDSTSSVQFFDEDGNEISTVPENHIVSVSAYLEGGKTYAPVLSAEIQKGEPITHTDSEDQSASNPGGSSGGCSAGIYGLVFLAALGLFAKTKH